MGTVGQNSVRDRNLVNRLPYLAYVVSLHNERAIVLFGRTRY